MKAILLICISLILSINVLLSQETGKVGKDASIKPSAIATRISIPPRIDGVLNDQCWSQSTVTSNFKQFDPHYNGKARFKTDVRIVFDDEAIYVAGMMFDSHPDSVKRQLGARDDDDLNADYFAIGFDTYNNQQDAYYFGVSASGIQLDLREVDETFNAVWSSAVSLNDSGWVAEMRIPYSALRFPPLNVQTWGMQIMRKIRRNREEDHWALQEKGSQNKLNYWGTLQGLSNIDPPLRIAAIPYFSVGIQNNSKPDEGVKATNTNYNGGMDLKWGLNESFTLDMILMPDFSQVQSDKIEKNLSAFEQEYDEKRPFFNEGTDLFQKAGLFYSRRIGRTPLKYYSINDSLKEGEYVVSNPLNARLLNAIKLSGRTTKGTGLGFFNAITGNTWATIKNSIGNERKMVTDPVTNYNIMVIDQNLKNNSSIYLINTNVIRPEGWQQSNVTAAGIRLADKSSTYQVQVDLSVSSNTKPITNIRKENKKGIFYNVDFQKIKGNFRFVVFQNAMDKNYNQNDLGINRMNDWVERGTELSYNIYESKGIFKEVSHALFFFRQGSVSTKKNMITLIRYTGRTTFTNYLHVGYHLLVAPFERFDFYESRNSDAAFKLPGVNEYQFFFSSDYRKVLALDGTLNIAKDYKDGLWQYYNLMPIIRVSDRFKVTPQIEMHLAKNDKGWVSTNNNIIYFGNRDIQTITSSISAEYMFTNRMSLNLWLRQYRSKGDYNHFYTLLNDGSLEDNSEYQGDHNFNYNMFNIDLVYAWEFSPGSMLNIVWKNMIHKEDNLYQLDFFDNLNRLMKAPQINNLSLKVLYYLDYQMIKKKNMKSL